MRLRELRLRRGMTQRELGQKSGVSVVTVGSIERGVELPTMRTARLLAAALEVELTDIDEVIEAIDRALKKDPTGNRPVGVSSPPLTTTESGGLFHFSRRDRCHSSGLRHRRMRRNFVGRRDNRLAEPIITW